MGAAIIAIYFIGWALFHSLLASLRVKHLAGRLFGDAARRWYRLGFVAAAIITLIPLAALLFRLSDIPLYAVAAPWRWMMMGAQLAALVLLAWSIKSTDPLDFVGLRQACGARKTSGSNYRSTLTTHGLYRYSRHPMYFSSMLIMWLSPTMSVNLLTLFALMSLYFVVGSYHEERLLVRIFASEYLEYKKKVPRIFPGLPFPP